MSGESYQTMGIPMYKSVQALPGRHRWLRRLLKDKITFMGSEWGGKSTLINAIQPGLDLRTTNLRIQQQRTHTTTFAEMHGLDTGGMII